MGIPAPPVVAHPILTSTQFDVQMGIPALSVVAHPILTSTQFDVQMEITAPSAGNPHLIFQSNSISFATWLADGDHCSPAGGPHLLFHLDSGQWHKREQ